MSNPGENGDHVSDHDKSVSIIVNGRQKNWQKKEISFAEVVALSELPSTADTIFTVTYRKGDGHKPEGTMSAGDAVKVKDGMIFNVTSTDKS